MKIPRDEHPAWALLSLRQDPLEEERETQKDEFLSGHILGGVAEMSATVKDLKVAELVIAHRFSTYLAYTEHRWLQENDIGVSNLVML